VRVVHDRTVFVIVCVVAAMAALWTGWTGRAVLGAVIATVALTTVFSLDAVNNSENDGLWPVGAALVAICTPLAFAMVAGAARWLRRRHHSGPDAA
jgi:hypothetical protein